MSILVGELVLNQNLICVSPADSLAHALQQMIDNDFSQLPVINEESIPLGIVTSDSIARALLHFGAKIEDLRVDDALAKLPTYKADEELLDLLDPLLTASAILIVAASGKLLGIITEYDTTQYFRQRAEDIVRVSDIESALKQHLLIAYNYSESNKSPLDEAINRLGNSLDGTRRKSKKAIKEFQTISNDTTINDEQIQALVDKQFPVEKKDRTFYDLTLAEYIQLARTSWAQLEPAFRLGVTSWTKMLEDVRITRNKLAHFRGDISPVERHRLRFCADWFKTHQPIIKEPKDAEPLTVVDVTAPINPAPVTEEVDPTVDAHFKLRNSVNILRSTTKAKYQPFIDFIKSRTEHELKFQFGTIELLLGQPFPKAAREHVSWWTKPSLHTELWIKEGWRVTAVDVNHGIVEFLRWLPQNPEMRRVSVDTPWETIFWSNAMNSTQNSLYRAISYAGREPLAVAAYLEKNEKPQNFKVIQTAVG
jgi:CBS domain-containing protein